MKPNLKTGKCDIKEMEMKEIGENKETKNKSMGNGNERNDHEREKAKGNEKIGPITEKK